MLFRFHVRSGRLPFSTVASLLLAACSPGHNPQVAAPPMIVVDHGTLRVPENSPLRQRLKVQPVALREMTYSLTAPATIEADPAHTAQIFPPLAGRVAELKVGLGDRVLRGQVLAVIASGDYAQALADRTRANDALASARVAWIRAEKVEEAGGAAQKDLEAAHSALVQAHAEYDRTAARLASFGEAISGKEGASRMAVVSPTDGSVTALNAATGVFLNDPSAELMTVTDLDHVWVTADVAENEASQVEPGQRVDMVLPAWPGRRLHGNVQSVSAVLDADTRRVKVRIAVDNPDGALKPNMFATATFRVPQPKVLLVPQSALLMNDDSVTVFVETSPWCFVRRPVTLGRGEGGLASVLKGLHPGDRVVVAGGVLINDQ